MSNIKEGEIQRMNFLSQGRGRFSYRKMAIALGVWAGFLLIIYVGQQVRQSMISRGITVTKKHVEALNIQKDKQLDLVQLMSRENIGISGKQDLRQIIERRPKWSRILHSYTGNLPPLVWLDSVSVAPTEKGFMFVVKGRAKSQKDITSLITQIETSGQFRKTSLVKSNQAEGAEDVYLFEVNTYPIMAAF